MTISTGDREAAVRAAIRTYGGDLSRWPDRDLAKAAAETVLADRSLRASLDEARALERGFQSLRREWDGEIAASGATARIREAAVAAVSPRPFGRLRWAAAIAIVLFAAGLGSVADVQLGIGASVDRAGVEVVDPLVFGPLASLEP